MAEDIGPWRDPDPACPPITPPTNLSVPPATIAEVVPFAAALGPAIPDQSHFTCGLRPRDANGIVGPLTTVVRRGEWRRGGCEVPEKLSGYRSYCRASRTGTGLGLDFTRLHQSP